MVEVFESEAELDALMARIRGRQMPNDQFSHSNHLAMAACTILEAPSGSLERVRKTILALNASNKVEQTLTGGYHETLTVVWHRLIAAHLAALPPEAPRLRAVNSVLHAFQDKSVVLKHYSRDRIMSWEARRGFVEPDLAPLPEDPTEG